MKTFPGSANEPSSDADVAAVEAKLLAGVYDRLLEDFRRELDAAELALRECHEALEIEKARILSRRSRLRLVGTSSDEPDIAPR